MTTKQKLELTWIDKDQIYKIEPRILVKDENLSYHSKKSYSKKDIFDNTFLKKVPIYTYPLLEIQSSL
jgi:adenine-specific DNA-methyltransferase